MKTIQNLLALQNASQTSTSDSESTESLGQTEQFERNKPLPNMLSQYQYEFAEDWSSPRQNVLMEIVDAFLDEWLKNSSEQKEQVVQRLLGEPQFRRKV